MVPRVTVITAVYNEELSLDRYYETVKKVFFSAQDVYFEIIFVDDGSQDGSWKKIQKICQESSRCSAIQLSRNLGAHVALSAGIQHATGDAVVTLACDLQDPAEVVLEFVKKWQEGAEIVWGKRRQREDEAWKIWTSKIFFKLLERYAMPKNSKFTTGSFFLIDKKVAECFKSFEEHNRITFALVAWTGFKQDAVYYDRKQRIAGKSGWTFWLMIKTMYDAFIAFSNIPARLVTIMGMLVWSFCIGYGSLVIMRYILVDSSPEWTAMMLALCILFGIMFLFLGLFMEYLRRIHTEVTRRPLYFISRKINIDHSFTFPRG